MKKKIVASVITTMLIVSSICPSYAHSSAGEHWQDLRYVLFGNAHYRCATQKAENSRIVLERASSLCIDQFGGSSGLHLKQLMIKGVKGLPASISDINLDATANNHHLYTRLGWNESYVDADASYGRNPQWSLIWRKRQELLSNSVEHVFDFTDIQKKEAFCSLLYYPHILGDHIEFKYGTYLKGSSNVIVIAGGHGQTTFLSELMDALAMLFKGQLHSYHYMLMIRELMTEEILLASLLNQTYMPSPYMERIDIDNMDDEQVLILLNESEKMSTPALFAASYTAHAKRILEILSGHVPFLLKEEVFSAKHLYSRTIRYRIGGKIWQSILWVSTKRGASREVHRGCLRQRNAGREPALHCQRTIL